MSGDAPRDPTPPASFAERYAYAYTDWYAPAAEEPDWLVYPFIEAGLAHALYGRRDVGKSLIALDWSIRMVRAGGIVLYLDKENGSGITVERAVRWMGADPAELKDRLCHYAFAGLPKLNTGEGRRDLIRGVVEHDAQLVVLDTTSRFVTGNENAAETFEGLSEVQFDLKRHGVSVLRLDHGGKDPTKGQRGTEAKNEDVDAIWLMETVTPEREFRLTRERNRTAHGPALPSQLVTRHGGRFHPGEGPLRHSWSGAGEPGADGSRGVSQIMAALDALKVVPDASRRTAEKTLRDHGYAYRTTDICAALRERKARQDRQSGIEPMFGDAPPDPGGSHAPKNDENQPEP